VKNLGKFKQNVKNVFYIYDGNCSTYIVHEPIILCFDYWVKRPHT